jgi:hypothetical protein
MPLTVSPAFEKRPLADPFAQPHTPRPEKVTESNGRLSLAATAIVAFCLSAFIGDALLGGGGRAMLADRIEAVVQGLPHVTTFGAIRIHRWI